MTEFKDTPLGLKKCSENDNNVISIRIKENTFSEIDKIASEVNCSWNELINILLNYGINNLTIK